jgi:hypothetical protein
MSAVIGVADDAAVQVVTPMVQWSHLLLVVVVVSCFFNKELKITRYCVD